LWKFGEKNKNKNKVIKTEEGLPERPKGKGKGVGE
jgi:hypothetical protein